MPSRRTPARAGEETGAARSGSQGRAWLAVEHLTGVPVAVSGRNSVRTRLWAGEWKAREGYHVVAGGGAVAEPAHASAGGARGQGRQSGPKGKTGPDSAGSGSGRQVGEVESARVVDQRDFQQLQLGQVHAGSCVQRALLPIREPLVVTADAFRSEEHREGPVGVVGGEAYVDRLDLRRSTRDSRPVHLMRVFGIALETAMKYVKAARPHRFIKDPTQP